MNKELIEKIRRPILYQGVEYKNGKDFLDRATIIGEVKFVVKKKIPFNKTFYIKDYMCDEDNLFMRNFHIRYNNGICCPKPVMKGVVLMEEGILVKIRTEEWIGWLTRTSVKIEDYKEE